MRKLLRLYVFLSAVAIECTSLSAQNVVRAYCDPAPQNKTLHTSAGDFKAVDMDKYNIPVVGTPGDMADYIKSLSEPRKRANSVNDNINNYNWAAMDGKATFHEDLGNVIFSLPVSDYETPILQATNSAETYALGPFNSSYPYYQDIKEAGFINSSQAGYLWLKADTHDYVTFPIFSTGWLWQWEDGTTEVIYVASLAWVMEFNGHDRDLVKNAGLGGINEGGHIYFPCTGSVVFTTPSLLETENPWYELDDDGKFGFTLPGVTVSEDDDKIELSLKSYCYDDNRAVVHMKAGRNIKIFKYNFYSEFSEDMYDDVIAGGSGGEYVEEGDITLDLNGDVKGNTRIYFAVVAGTDAGVIKDADYVEIHLVPNDDDDWNAPMVGYFNESIVSGIYDGFPADEYAVAYQTHKENQGYIRIINPYSKTSDWAGSELNRHGHHHNHYLFIDATDPDAVVLESSPLGLIVDEEAGDAIVSSHAHESMKMEGKSKADVKALGLTGTLVDNKITFPANSIWFAENNYKNGQYFKTNKDGKLSLRMTSDKSGVALIPEDGDDSSVEYFNLYGQRMDRPVKGCVTVVRKGGKSSLIVF